MSLSAAQTAGIGLANSSRSKSLLASLFHTDDEEDDTATDTKAEAARAAPAPVPAARPQQTALASVLSRAAGSNAPSSAGGGLDRWATAVFVEPPRASGQTIPRVPLSNPGSAPALTPWPIREMDTDHVRLGVVSFAAQPQSDHDAGLGVSGAEERSIHVAASGQTRGVVLRESNTVAAKKGSGRTQAAAPVAHVKVVAQTATAGMHYDDPWLRAMILAPRLYGSMTVTLYGEPDFTKLRSLMDKPTVSVAMSFANEPYPGITANSFSGEAVVILNTYAFTQRTAWLQ